MSIRSIRTKGKPAVKTLICSLFAFSLNGCAPFYYEMPAPAQSSNAGAYGTLAPEELCAKVRDGAFNHRTVDAALGISLAGLGAVAAASGIAFATKEDTKDGLAEAGALAGAGAIAVAAGVYFLTRAGEDRANYWLANGALVQIRADRSQSPYDATPAGKTVHQWALEAKKNASDAASVAAKSAAKATQADALVTEFQLYDLKDKAPYATLPITAGGPQTSAQAVAAAKVAHQTADDDAKQAADLLTTATLAANALAVDQLAWADCAKALTTVSGNDAAASLAFANAAAAASKGGK